ncbi:MAG: hypothetical protein LIO51_04655 [Clostridiales bacterium]|nr:hypothetical protein [Clostridiales bacterium]
MGLSREEQESIFLFNEADNKAAIYTHNKALQNKLRLYAQERPAECQFVKDCGEGGLEFVCPKTWLRIRPPRVASEAQKAAARAALAKAHSINSEP